jgi:Lipopolysaccharide-assembly
MGTLRPLTAAVVASALVALAPAGCGYSIRPPYDPSIRTVYVPVFRSYTFREDANLKLTECVIKEIERRTPYKVVGSPEGADTTLSGIIQYVEKNILVENPNNLPRHLTATVNATVTWEDNRPARDEKKKPPSVVVIENVSFYPELGETASLGYQKAFERMAQQIVGMMEQPW